MQKYYVHECTLAVLDFENSPNSQADVYVKVDATRVATTQIITGLIFFVSNTLSRPHLSMVIAYVITSGSQTMVRAPLCLQCLPFIHSKVKILAPLCEHV